MTYLEHIVYLTGEYLQVSQYCLKNAFRVASLFETSKVMNIYTKGQEMLIQAEASSVSLMEEYEFKGSENTLLFLKDKGISEKDFAILSKVLKRKDYISTFFYIDKGSDFALEDVKIYESTIRELDEDIERAKKLNLLLDSTASKLYQLY